MAYSKADEWLQKEMQKEREKKKRTTQPTQRQATQPAAKRVGIGADDWLNRELERSGSKMRVGNSAQTFVDRRKSSAQSEQKTQAQKPTAYQQWAANNPAMAKAQEARSTVAKAVQETKRNVSPKKTTIVDDVTNLIARDTESIDYKIADIERQMDAIDKERRTAYDAEVGYLRDGKWEYVEGAERATAELDRRYNELEAERDTLVRNKEKNAKALKLHTYNALAGLEDFEQFSAQGASIANPDIDRVYAGEKTRHASGIGAQYLQNSQTFDDVQNKVAFVRDNWDNLDPYLQEWLKDTPYGKYRHMGDDEVNTYNYLLAKDGKEAADEYLDFIEETLNWHEGTEIGKKKMSVENDFLRTTANTLYGLGAVGPDQWMSGTAQLLSADRLPTSSTQYAGQYIRENAGPVERFFFDAGTVTGNMLPSILISKGTGLVGSALGWGAKAAGTASTIAGATAVGSSASGNAYNQALDEGYTKEEARKYATLVGASEAGLSAILGSNLVGGKVNGLMKARIQGIDNALGRIAGHWALSTGGEVTEEVLQEYLEPAFRSLIFDVDYDAPNFEDVAYVALLTALSAGAPGTVDAVATETTNSRTGKSVKASEGGVQALLDGALALDPSTESHKKATVLMNKKGEPNDAEIGDLKRTFEIDRIKADNGRIKEEVEKAKQFGEDSKAYETATRIEEKLAKGKEVSDEDIAELLTDNAVAENDARSKQRAADADALVENAPAVEELVQQGRDLGGRASKEAERIASKVANGVEVTSNDIQRLMEANENTKTAVDKYTKRVIDNAVARKITSYGEHGAHAFADAVNTSNGQDIRDVQLEFDTPYQAGLMNKNPNTMTFNTPLEKLAFNAGVQDYIAQRKVDKKHKAIVYTEEDSIVEWKNAPSDITQEEKNRAEFIVKNMGTRMDFSNAEEAFNAFYDSDTGRTKFDAGFGISPELTKKLGNLDYLKKVEKLAKERGRSFTFYIAHEIAVHRAMDLAPTEMRAFVNAMYEYKQRGSETNLARDKSNFYASRGKTIDTYTAFEEVVADSILDLYDGDEQAFMDAVYRIANGTNESAKKGARTFLERIADTIARLKAWVLNLTGNARASVEQSISEIENLRNMFEKALSSSMETVKQARKSGESAKVDMGTLEENAGLGYTGKKMSMKETEGSEHGSSKANQRDAESDARTRAETEDRSRVPKEVGRNRDGLSEKSVWVREKEIIEADVAEYGVPLDFVSPEEWKKKFKDSHAVTRGGKVFVREGVPGEEASKIIPHEANHVMRQLKYKPYLDFLFRVPSMIDTTNESGRKLLQGAAEHRGIDLFEELTDEQVDILYDEVNAIVSGVAVKDIEGDVLENLREAFYDYDGYKTELKAIHQQFKSHRKSSDSGTRYSLKDSTAQKNTTAESGGDVSVAKKNFEAAPVNQELYNLVAKVKSGKFQQNDSVDLGVVADEIAQKILEETGVNPTGYRIVIEARQIEHILKDHGETGGTDRSMADVNDIAKMEFALGNPDSIVNAGRTNAYFNMVNGYNRTAKTVLYERLVGKKSYYIVQAVPDTKAKTLYIVSAFIGEPGYLGQKKEAPRLTNAKRPGATSETVAMGTSKSSISQTEGNSNRKFSLKDSTAQKNTTAESGVKKYSFKGINKFGIEVYETSAEVKAMRWKDRKKQFFDIMENEYKGRTAKFVRSGHAYYATFEKKDVDKNIYGDTKSDDAGRDAKINAGADGDIFNLVENSTYRGSSPEKGKVSPAHRGVGGWDYFIKKVQIDGRVFDLLANVRKKPNGEFVYDITLFEDKKTEAAPPKDIQKRMPQNGARTASNGSITQTGGNSNRKFSLKGESPTAQKNTTVKSGVKYSIKMSFADQVDATLRKTLGRNQDVYVSDTPSVLMQIGFTQLPMLMTQRHIRDINHAKSLKNDNWHGLSAKTIKQLPQMLSSPAMVVSSATRSDSVVVVTDKFDAEGNPIIVSVKPDGQGHYNRAEVNSNFVTSMYGKDGFSNWLSTAVGDGRVLYNNKKRTQSLLSRVGLQLPKSLNKDGFFMPNISQFWDGVKKKQLTQIDGKHSLKGEEEFRKEVNRIREEGKKAGKSALEVERDVSEYVGVQYTELIKEYGAIEKGENPSRDIEVPKRTEEDRRVSKTVRTILEAEVTPDTIVPKLQEMVASGDFSYDTYTDKTAMAGAERTIKSKSFPVAFADWINEVDSGKVNKTNTALGWALYNQAANAGDVASAINILNRMVGHQRNAAQAVQATRILKKLTPDAQLYSAVKAAQKLEDDLKKKFPKLDGIKIDEALAEEFMSAETQEERDRIMREIYHDIGKQMPASWMDKFNAWRYMAMLTNPRTHIRNIGGNAGFAPLVIAKSVTAGAIEASVDFVARKTTGKGIGRTKGRVKGDMLKAAWEDFANVQDIIKGSGKYNDTANANRHIEDGRRIYKTKALEAVRKGNSNLLELEDLWFSKPHYAYALAKYCSANGITTEQLRRGKALGNARAYAIREAQKATYRDVNAFSEAIGNLGRKRNSNKVEKAIGVAMEGVLPFRKTPANILARGVEYSPIGLVKGLTADLIKVGKGEMTAAEAIDNISAGLTGTGLLALGVFLAAQGIIRGAGGSDDDERKFEELQGHQAYSLELPDGTSITLDWLAPEALPFFVGVNLCETAKEGKNGANLSDILSAITNISDPMLELSCLQSLNDAFDSLGYANENETSALMAVLASSVTSYLTQYVPTILGQAERSAQDKRMTTYTEKGAWLTSDMQYTLGKTSARMPGWDFGQIPYIDAWGRTENTGSTVANVANNFLNPAYTSKVESSPMEQELARLYDITGEAKVLPKRADKYFHVDGERKDLSADEYVQYATKKGELSHNIVSDLVSQRGYKGLADNEKAEAVSLAYEYANAHAKKAIDGRYKLDSWIGKADAGKSLGVTPSDYILVRVVTQDIDSGLKDKYGKTINNSKGLRIMQAIYNIPGLNDSKRRYLFESLGVGKEVRHYNKALVNQKLEWMEKQGKRK